MSTNLAALSHYKELMVDRQIENGQINTTKWLVNDIEINHTKVDYSGFGVNNSSDDKAMVRLHFTLAGSYSFYHKQLDQSFNISTGQHNIMCTQGMDLAVNNQSAHIETLGINFPAAMFADFLQDESDAVSAFGERVLNGRNVILSQKWSFSNLAIQQSIREIIQCEFNGELKKLFLMSKSIELLVLQIASITKDNQQVSKFKMTNGDREKMYAAREFLLSRLSNPPSLTEVAKHAGTNEYKLKKGFKHLFNTTVMGLLNEQRLSLAYERLADQQTTAAEIAFELGYSSPQHFSKAFKNKFAVTPMEIRQKS